MIPEGFDQLEAVAAVIALEQRAGFCADVQTIRLIRAMPRSRRRNATRLSCNDLG